MRSYRRTSTERALADTAVRQKSESARTSIAGPSPSLRELAATESYARRPGRAEPAILPCTVCTVHFTRSKAKHGRWRAGNPPPHRRTENYSLIAASAATCVTITPGPTKRARFLAFAMTMVVGCGGRAEHVTHTHAPP